MPLLGEKSKKKFSSKFNNPMQKNFQISTNVFWIISNLLYVLVTIMVTIIGNSG